MLQRHSYFLKADGRNMEFNYIDDCNETQIQHVIRVTQVTVASVRNGKLVFVKRRGKSTVELPRVECIDHEKPSQAVQRLMTEHLGMLEYVPKFVGAYSVTDGSSVAYGMLYFAEITKVGPFPHGDFSVVYYLDKSPESSEQWSCPEMDMQLMDKALEICSTITSKDE